MHTKNSYHYQAGIFFYHTYIMKSIWVYLSSTRTVSLVICFLLMFPAVITSTHGLDEQSLNDDAWLRKINGVRVLHVTGSSYDMGYQHGSLLEDECLENLRAYQRLAEQVGFTYDDFLVLWSEMEEYIPLRYHEEMQGMADALDLPFETIAIGNIMTVWVHCSGFAAWGPATIHGELIHGASLDYPLRIRDPVSEKTVQDNFVVIFREPTGGYASLDPSYAGLTGSAGGFNEQGVAVNVHTCWSHDETVRGTPMVFRLRMILDNASDVNHGLTILENETTRGWNFIISGGQEYTGFAVEQTGNISYSGTWNHPTESTAPFWSIDSVVRRTNIYINQTTAATQRTIYDPRIFPILGYLFGVNSLGWSRTAPFSPWLHYKELSEELVQNWGNLNLEMGMEVFRRVYNGNTSVLFSLFQLLRFYTTLHQWVATPSTGDMLLSVARNNRSAYTQPIHHLNLFELLESMP